MSVLFPTPLAMNISTIPGKKPQAQVGWLPAVHPVPPSLSLTSSVDLVQALGCLAEHHPLGRSDRPGSDSSSDSGKMLSQNDGESLQANLNHTVCSGAH